MTKKKTRRNCKNCGIECNRPEQVYCSNNFQQEFRSNKLLQEWKSGNEAGYSGKAIGLKPFVRRYLFEKFRSRCRRCGWCLMNTKTGKIPLEVNHIDGNAKNNIEENLELLCPNCHSLTHNFRNLNKKSARTRKGEVHGMADF